MEDERAGDRMEPGWLVVGYAQMTRTVLPLTGRGLFSNCAHYEWSLPSETRFTRCITKISGLANSDRFSGGTQRRREFETAGCTDAPVPAAVGRIFHKSACLEIH
jgi:hypothetical protein